MVGQTELAADASEVGRSDRSWSTCRTTRCAWRSHAQAPWRGRQGRGADVLDTNLCILMILANRLVVMELKKILRKKYFLFLFLTGKNICWAL